ncbi:DEAD-box ATP-dependent RNA helicase 47, mitochondrial [Linum grandiflorum]
MPALASTTRLLVLAAGHSLPSHKLTLLPANLSLWRHSVRFFSRVAKDHHGPLTLASLGFNNDAVSVSERGRKIKSEDVRLRSPAENHKPKVKPVSIRAVKATRSVEDLALAPFSAKSFSELGLPPLLIERLESEGFNVPTDVQSAAVPTILKDHDVVIQSYTGSGKTLAYLLPILAEIGPLKGDDGGGKRKDIEAVIVAPSRELGMQIVREFEKLLGPENKRVVQQLVGGANRSRQEEALRKNKPAIVVGTPGRIAEISASGKLHTHGCRFLVLDEVDELLSFNFREAMHRILDHVGRRPSADGQGVKKSDPTNRRTILVSATVPYSVIRAARSWANNPVLVQAKSVIPLESIPPSGPSGPMESDSKPQPAAGAGPQVQSLPPALKHYYTVSKMQHKVDALRRCVHALDAKCVIAFMNHSRQLKDVVHKLEARGLNAAELHGDLGKLGRSTVLKKFKKGELRVLVTNELSARGLDVPECDVVINLDLPTDSTHYAHRAGRTGRLGRRGTVVTICEESELFVVRKLQKQLGVPISSCEFTDGKLVADQDEKEEISGPVVIQQACST